VAYTPGQGTAAGGDLSNFPIRTGETRTVTPPNVTPFKNAFGVLGGGGNGWTDLTPVGGDAFNKSHDEPVTKSPTQLVDELKKMSSDDLKKLQQKLKDAGADVLVTGHADQATIGAYTQAVMTVASEQQAQPDSKTTVDSYLDDLIANADPSKSSYDGPTTVTKTTSSTETSDSEDARSIISSTIEQQLGRKATDKDIAAFTSALQQYQQMHPQTSTETQYSDNGNPTGVAGAGDPSKGVVNDTTNTQDTVNPTNFAQNYLDDHYQAETQGLHQMDYYNWALDILGSPGSTGH
jgi:hypothetical protein